MRLYAESSAILAWLLGEAAGARVLESLSGASLVTVSDLTLIEVERCIERAKRDGRMDEAGGSDARAALNRAAADWSVLEMGGEIIERAKRPFPREPVRTLDAIHLATALAVRETVGPVSILSLDERIRGSARELGFVVVPGPGDTIHDGP